MHDLTAGGGHMLARSLAGYVVAHRHCCRPLRCPALRSKDEIQAFEQFAKQDGIHDELFARIAPNIYGSDDIKRAVACLLFGGARKVWGGGGGRKGGGAAHVARTCTYRQLACLVSQ